MGGESTGFDLAGEIWRLTRNMLRKEKSEMTVSEELREKARRLGKIGFSCSTFMADEFGIECGEVSCGECYARLLERIADRAEEETDELCGLRDENERLRDMVRERQLPDGVEWPRFEDGEPVRFGDEVEFDGEVGKVARMQFELLGWAMTLNRNLDLSYLSGAYGERLKRPTPKVLDADGAPIEVGDTVYCDGEDEPLRVVGSHAGTREVTLTTANDSNFAYYTVEPSRLSHKRPDSWERIEEDAYHLVMSEYLETPEKDVGDIVRRAKALAKAGEM